MVTTSERSLKTFLDQIFDHWARLSDGVFRGSGDVCMAVPGIFPLLFLVGHHDYTNPGTDGVPCACTTSHRPARDNGRIGWDAQTRYRQSQSAWPVQLV